MTAVQLPHPRVALTAEVRDALRVVMALVVNLPLEKYFEARPATLTVAAV